MCKLVLVMMVTSFGVVVGDGGATCGQGIEFMAMEKQLMEEENMTANQYCSQFLNKEKCTNDDYYNVCNWCDEHKPQSSSDDKSIRCVTALYHWLECQRRDDGYNVQEERMMQSSSETLVDWTKSEPANVEEKARMKGFDFQRLRKFHTDKTQRDDNEIIMTMAKDAVVDEL